jgi:ComF family protein
VRSAVQLDAITRPLVHRFKYQGWWRLSADFAVRMAPMLAQLGPGDLVPVPLGRARQRQRGFNQAEALASALAALSGRAVRPERLARMRETPSQTRLTPEERRANLSEAFQAGSVSHVPVILVDDVFTTGATLCSAAEALLDAGVPQVAAITFARAGLPLAGEPRRL